MDGGLNSLSEAISFEAQIHLVSSYIPMLLTDWRYPEQIEW